MPAAKQRKSQKRATRAEVSSSGLAVFIIGWLIALFFGGAVRSLMSERQVAKWIERTMATENPPFTLQFSSAKVRLADGWEPRFGLEFNDLEIAAKDQCQVPARLTLNQLFLPISLSDLMHGRLKFNFIRADEVKLELTSVICSKPAAQPPPQPVAGPALKKSVVKANKETEPQWQAPAWYPAFHKFIENRWAKEMANTRQWVDGLKLNKFIFLSTFEGLPEIDLQDLILKTNDGGKMTLSFGFLPKAAWTSQVFALPTKVKIAVDQDLAQIEWHGHMREGQGELKADLELGTGNLVAKFSTSHLPAGQILEALTALKVVTDSVQPRRMWLSCDINYSGQLSQWWTAALVAEQCKLEGEAGKVSSDRVELTPWETHKVFKPFTVTLESLSLQKLLETFQRQGYSGVISQFGDLSGRLQVSDRENMRFLGELKGLELAFSRKSVRAKQVIERLNVEFILKDGEITGLIRDLQLLKGNMKGYLSFALDRHFLNGAFQVKIDELEFNPEVQGLMVGGRVSPLALFGSGKLSNGSLTQWSGDLGALRITGDRWSTELFKFKSQFEKGVLTGQLRATAFDIAQESPLGTKLAAVLGDSAKANADLRFRNLHARLEFQGGEGRWKSAQGQLASGEAIVGSAGEWKDGNAHGWMSVDLPGAHMVKWDVEGPWLDLKFSPMKPAH